MKLVELLKAKKTFAGHLQERMPTAIAYRIFKLVKLADDNEDFYTDRVNALIDECGEKDKDGKLVHGNGGGIKLIDGKKEVWENGIKEIDNTEIEAPKFSFTVEELAPLNLSVADIINIQNFIKE